MYKLASGVMRINEFIYFDLVCVTRIVALCAYIDFFYRSPLI